MIFLVCGGRNHTPFRPFKEIHFLNRLKKAYDPYNKVTELWHGNARGADTEGEKWGFKQGLFICCWPADWGKHGKQAGFIRNELMCTKLSQTGDISLVIAFPGGNGTAHMVHICKKAGHNILQYTEGDELGELPSYDSLLPF